MTWFALPKAIRALLLADEAIAEAVGNRVHYQEIPEASEFPHIWFSRTGRDRTECLGGEEEMTVERFSFEIISDEDAEVLIDALVSALESFAGDVEGRDVQLVEVEDADDDYIFKSVGEGEPDYLHALTVAVYGVVQ